MLGDAPFSNISFRNQSDDVKGIIERTTIKSRWGVGRQNLTGTKIFISSMGQVKDYFHIYIHTNKTYRVPRFTRDRKVADSTPPPPRPTNNARLHLRCVRIDPRMTPHPFHRLRLHSNSTIQKSVLFIERPRSVIICCFVLLRPFFFKFCFSLFWKKIVPPPLSSPSYATKFVYLPIVKYIQAHIPTRRV